MTTTLAGIGDDGRVHRWRWTMGEAMRRMCDGVESTNVELWTRDQHSDREACVPCKETPRP